MKSQEGTFTMHTHLGIFLLHGKLCIMHILYFIQKLIHEQNTDTKEIRAVKES